MFTRDRCDLYIADIKISLVYRIISSCHIMHVVKWKKTEVVFSHFKYIEITVFDFIPHTNLKFINFLSYWFFWHIFIVVKFQSLSNFIKAYIYDETSINEV